MVVKAISKVWMEMPRGFVWGVADELKVASTSMFSEVANCVWLRRSSMALLRNFAVGVEAAASYWTASCLANSPAQLAQALSPLSRFAAHCATRIEASRPAWLITCRARSLLNRRESYLAFKLPVV